MRYLYKSETKSLPNTIVLEHKGELLEFSIKTYRHLVIDERTVYDINKYWSELPEQIQDTIFNIYLKISDVLESIENPIILFDTLSKHVKELLSYHRFDDIMQYLKFKARIKIPDNLKTEITGDLVPDLTYLKNEYEELLGLILALKCMIPVWGRYVTILGSEATAIENRSNVYKEYRAAGLLRVSDIVNCEAYKRLYRYVDTFWKGYTQDHSAAAIISGLDETQVPDWLMANVLIRKIAIAELIQHTSPEVPQMVVTTIYKFIEQHVTTMDKNFGGRINDKSLEGSMQGEDDNTSVIENYKIKQEISEGTIMTYDVYLRHHPVDILTKIDSSCPVELYHKVKELYTKMLASNFEPNKVGITICQLVLHPIVIDRMLNEVGFDALLEAHLITYTLLQHWGFSSISLFIFSKQVHNNIISNTFKKPISEVQLEKLNHYYPHPLITGHKRKLSKLDSNMATVGIKAITDMIGNGWWQLAPWENRTMYPQLNVDGDMAPVPSDISYQLADMIIHFNGLPYKS